MAIPKSKLSQSETTMAASKLRETMRFVWRLDFLRMAVLWTWCLVFSYVKLLMLSWRSKPSSRRIHRRRSFETSSSFRPLCIITGATSGLGAAAAYALSKEGFYVVLVGRSSHLLSKTMKDIKSKNENAQLKAFQADLSSFLSIVEFKESLEKWISSLGLHSSVQLLINNAGILATSFRLSADGYDQTMATNYIGAFCLTKILLPLLENSPIPSRIVNVTSFTHRNVSRFQADYDHITGKCFLRSGQYPCAQAYENSKLCLLLLSYELHRKLGLKDESQKVTVIAADPGAVETNIMREIPSCISLLAFLVLKLLGLLLSPERGVRSIVNAALAPPEISGLYSFGGSGQFIRSSELSYDVSLAQQVWNTSSDIYLQSLVRIKKLETSTDFDL